MPRFTIGIPTYNRANYLQRSLGCAAAQTYDDLEIIVSDNASTDTTAEVARSFGDRVRYHRNESNLGMWRNFLQVVGLAQGEYFAWLQDDDAVHQDFARRAAAALDGDEAIALYTAYSFDTHSHDTFVLPVVLGPPIAMDWMNPQVRVVAGSMVLPISFFLTFSMPPITAYRTEVLRRAIRDLDPEHILYNERILQSRAVAGRKIAVDPWTAGVFFKHPHQGSLLAGSCDIPERSRQWVGMANELARMLAEHPSDDWRPQLDDWLRGLSAHGLESIYHNIAPPEYWSGLSPLALEVCSRYLEHLPEPLRQAHQAAMNPSRTPKEILKGVGRQITPPIFWSLLKSTTGRVR